MSTAAGMRAMIMGRKPGYSLEAPFYLDDDIYQLDMDVIFGRHWIYVGVEPDVPRPGDCMATEFGRHAILVARDDDMAIHAFHNVCRHRGARLLPPGKSSVGNIVCPYHQWTYGRGGELRFAPHMQSAIDVSRSGLRKIHLRSVAGLLFVCLAEQPPTDFDRMAELVAPYIAPHDIAHCKVAHEEDIIEHGNWKLTMENNRECYHCTATHPELTRSIFAEGFGFAPTGVAAAAAAARFKEMVVRSHNTWESGGLPSREVEHLADWKTGFRTERLPLEEFGESETMDTRVACTRLLGNLSEASLGALSLWTQPNSWHHFMSDHIVTFAALPLSAESTLLRTKWLVHQDAVEGRDYDLPNLIAVWHATNRQDAALVGRCCEGIRSSGYLPGPYSTDTEGLVEKFCVWYVQRLAETLLN